MVDFSENREPHRLIRKNTITAPGGLSAPIHSAYNFDREYRGEGGERFEIRPGPFLRLRGRKRFFAWDDNWGLPLYGGIPPKLRELFPIVRVARGAIEFFKPSR